MRKQSILVVGAVVLLTITHSAFAGTIVGWGQNVLGQTNVPVGNDFIAIEAGTVHSLALKSDGSIVCWGYNLAGRATAPSGNDFIAISGGNAHNLALRSDGSVFAWGDNSSGECDVPIGNDFVVISAGESYSLALKSDGSLVAWGKWDPCVLNIPLGSNFSDISAGYDHALALRSDGSVVAWGSNAEGEGDVPTGVEFLDIDAGNDFSLGLKKDGSLIAWGSNRYGQLNVPSGNDFVAISAGYNGGVALRRNGSPVAWGSNTEGQLNVPIGVAGCAIVAGGYHNLILVPEPAFLLHDPNGSEVVVSLQIHTIIWSSTGSINNVLIEYSTDNGVNWNHVSAVPNTGSYDWIVPEVNSNQCLVRLSDASNPTIYDTSDNVFTISHEYPSNYPTLYEILGGLAPSIQESGRDFVTRPLPDANVVAFILLESAGYANETIFGIYSAYDPQQKLQLFSGSDSLADMTTVKFNATDGTARNLQTGQIANIEKFFGFYLTTPQNGGTTYYTDLTRNPDSSEHGLIYNTSGFAGVIESDPDTVIAFEDFLGLGDRDYNDMVVGITNAVPLAGFNPHCTKQIPGDINVDCKVNLADFAEMVSHWLECNLDPQEACFGENPNTSPVYYTLTVNSSGASSVEISSSTGHSGTTNYAQTITSGTSVSLTAPAMVNDKEFTGWTGDVPSNTSTISFAVTDSKTVTANYATAEPAGMVWVSINDPGVSGHESFNGQMSKYETTNAQYCQFLNVAKTANQIIVFDNIVYATSNTSHSQPYYDLTGSGNTVMGAINGGAARIKYIDGIFIVDSGFENHPVTYVSWYGAMAFCNYYSYRLPTEWEWQAVADYDGSYTYGCGTTINTSIANYFITTIHLDGTTAVGAFGAYGYGMCDMAGNVWEWTSNCCYSDCAYGTRVVRGGSWNSAEVICTDRNSGGTANRMHWDFGFRACR